MITAAQAGKKIAKYINKTWPADKVDVYETLVLSCNRAWQEGKWLGMTKEYFVRTQVDPNNNRYFIAPPGFKNLLAVNVDNKKREIRSGYFQFHKNGNGSIDVCQGCNWFQDVLDCGTQPLMIELDPKIPFKIAFRSLAAHERDDASISIQGITDNGGRLITYNKVAKAANSCGCNSVTKATADSELSASLGYSFKITKNFTYIENLSFIDITSIQKNFTNGDIEVIAIYEDGCGKKIAELAPWEQYSEYRRYLVPAKCGCKQVVHGIFKCNQQPDINFDEQILIIDHPEALISLAKGIDALYNSDQPDKAAVYVQNGISILEKTKRETESPEDFPIQIDGGTIHDPWETKEYY